MKNHSFFSGLMLALCFVFLATTAQAQFNQRLYRVTGASYPSPDGVLKITEKDGFYFSVLVNTAGANTKYAAAIMDLGGSYTGWAKNGVYRMGQMTGVEQVHHDIYPVEYLGEWTSKLNISTQAPTTLTIFLGLSENHEELMVILYDADGDVFGYYSGYMVFSGRLD